MPCGTLCYSGDYFAGHRDQILVESVNDAIAILSGTGTQLGQNVPGSAPRTSRHGATSRRRTRTGTASTRSRSGVHTNCGTSASQNRSTYMQAIDMRPPVIGVNVLPPGQSGFISAAGVPIPHLCDQVGLFDSFRYKPMPPAR